MKFGRVCSSDHEERMDDKNEDNEKLSGLLDLPGGEAASEGANVCEDRSCKLIWLYLINGNVWKVVPTYQMKQNKHGLACWKW